MKKEFENYTSAITWIAQNALSSLHSFILREELTYHHQITGRYYVYATVWN